MTRRRALFKLASILLRHVEHYVITAKATSESYVAVCTDVPEWVPTSDIVKEVPLEQLMDEEFETPWQLRIDAITTPTYPQDDFDTLITALLPGFGGRTDPLGRCTPYEIISELSNKWHDTADLFDIKDTDPSIVELRYDIGQSRYSATTKDFGYDTPGVVAEMGASLPRLQASDIGSAELQRSDRFLDYYDDHVWMRRMIYEMLPVAAYQMLDFGCSFISRHHSGHIEEYCCMPMMSGTAAAERVMRAQMDILGIAISQCASRPLGYVLSQDMSAAVTSLNCTGCMSVQDIGQYPAGLSGLDLHIASLASGYRPVPDLERMDQVRLNGAPALVRYRLYRQHEGDPLWPLLDQAFYDERA